MRIGSPASGSVSISQISRRSSCAATLSIAPPGAGARGDPAQTGKEGRPGDGVWPFSFDPDRTALDRPALWRADLAAPVVALDRAPPGTAGARAFAGHPAIVADREDETGRHLVIDAPGFRHRLWLRASGPDVPLVILLAPSREPVGAAAADAARRLLSGLLLAGGPPATHPTRFQRQRLTLLLHILDADLAGASNREIGTRLVYPWLGGISAEAWKASSERRRTQRLIAEARTMMRGGYRRLLAGR
jgi:hypothetical protein